MKIKKSQWVFHILLELDLKLNNINQKINNKKFKKNKKKIN